MPTASLSSLYTATLAISLYYDHFCASQSTAFLSLFLTISALVEGARARSFFTLPLMKDVASLTIECLAIKLLLIFLLEIPKRLDSSIYKGRKENISWDNRAGFWGRVLVLCANSVFFRGFRSHLSMDDLGVLAPNESAEQLAARFEQVWMAG